jgi:hypothetical protein
VARRLTNEQREAVIADLRATAGTPEGAYRRVAARCELSIASVAKIAQECGFTPANSDRERTRTATRAKVVDNAARRTEIAAKLLDVADEAIEDMSRQALVYNFGGRDNTYAERMLSRPDFRGRRDLALIAKTALDSHKMLDQYDSDASQAAAVDAWLKSMIGDPNASDG